MKLNIDIKNEEDKQDLIKQLNEMKFSTEWKDIKQLTGYYIDNQSKILNRGISAEFQYSVNKNTFKTKKQAQSSVAKAMLSQMMAQPSVNGD